MKYVFMLAMLLAAPSAFAATDYFLEIKGVDGETSSSAASPTNTSLELQRATDPPPTRASVGADTGTTGTTGTTAVDVAAASTEESKKGNVEYNWKVEEGEKLEGTGVEPDEIDVAADGEPLTPDLGVLLGDSDEEAAFRGGVKVAAGDVNGLTADERQSVLTAVKAHAEVRSGQDLEHFARGVLIENENMEEISLNFEKIKVSHRAQGKLLGIIPISYTERIEIATEGETAGDVKVMMPWFAFLITKKVQADELETSIGSDIASNLGGNENWDFGNRALILSTVSNVLKTKHDTAMNSIRNIK